MKAYLVLVKLLEVDVMEPILSRSSKAVESSIIQKPQVVSQQESVELNSSNQGKV